MILVETKDMILEDRLKDDAIRLRPKLSTHNRRVRTKWTPYSDIATYKDRKGVLYMAVTSYYNDVLPAYSILKVTPMPYTQRVVLRHITDPV